MKYKCTMIDSMPWAKRKDAPGFIGKIKSKAQAVNENRQHNKQVFAAWYPVNDLYEREWKQIESEFDKAFDGYDPDALQRAAQKAAALSQKINRFIPKLKQVGPAVDLF